jgi:hypothetical protein
MFDATGHIDFLDDPLRLTGHGHLKVAIPSAGSDWLVASHGSTLAHRGANAAGRIMSYVVMWRMSGKSKTHESTVAYHTPSAAIDFACTLFKLHPAEIWIEGPGGIRIERNAIFRQCQERGPSRA